MAQQILPSSRQPLLFSRTTDYTHMAVHTTRGLDGRLYHVLYVGTGRIGLPYIDERVCSFSCRERKTVLHFEFRFMNV